MPAKFTADTPRAEATIQEIVFSIALPHVEGEKLTAGGAVQMNQVRKENLRNNLAAQIAKMKEEGRTHAEMQEFIDKYNLSYEFGLRAGGTREVDPVKALMRSTAKQLVLKKLRAGGTKLKDVPKDQIDKLVDKTLSDFGEQLRAYAEGQVNQAKSLEAAISG